MNITKYETNLDKLENRCLICSEPITDDEFTYEDYFVVFRGHSKSCCWGYACFKCVKGEYDDNH